MGLDMYLRGKRYISEYFNKQDKEVGLKIAECFPELKHIPPQYGDASPVREVKVDVGYWRKVNAIHAWFVKNCQGGIDECQYTNIERDSLTELKELCQKVLDDHSLAPQLLPTQSGFFFGDTDYDERYFKGLENTIKIIDDALALPESWEFEYHSSW